MQATKTAREVYRPSVDQMLTQIRGTAEWFGQDINDQCRRAAGCTFDQITTFEQILKVCALQQAEKPEYNEPESTTCFQCGVECGMAECRACHEGCTASEYDRTRQQAFGITDNRRTYPHPHSTIPAYSRNE